jgi:hypothetical protein
VRPAGDAEPERDEGPGPALDPWYPSSAELGVARKNTRLLRTSDYPQWREARSLLLEAGLSLDDVVLAGEVSAGRQVLSCLAVSRDERVFAFNVIFGLDHDGNPLPKGQGRVGKWREIAPERIRLTDAGVPNTWLRAIVVAYEIFES